jgi:hypothetical protein
MVTRIDAYIVILGIIALAVLLFIGGCASRPISQGDFCDLARPHRFSDSIIDHMSDEEVKQELAYNRLGAKRCGWQP